MFEELAGLFLHMEGGMLKIRPAQLKINHKETAIGDTVAAIVDGVVDPALEASAHAALVAAIPQSVIDAVNAVGNTDTSGFNPNPNIGTKEKSMVKALLSLLLPFVESFLAAKLEPPSSAVPGIIEGTTTGLTAPQFEEAVALYGVWLETQAVVKL